jgi:hypothetical protein
VWHLPALGIAEWRRARERRGGGGRMHARSKAEVPARASVAAWPRRRARGLFGCGCPHEMWHGGMHVELWLDGSREGAPHGAADGGAVMCGRRRATCALAQAASMLRWTGQALSGSLCPGHPGGTAP